MPELPEVETVRAGLAPFMEGFIFDAVTLNRPNLRFAFADNFTAALTGQKLERLSRRAKFLRADLSSGEMVLMHLGMSGSFRVEGLNAPPPQSTPNPAHDHVIFDMSSGARIIYNDPRRFGFMELIAKGSPSRLCALGPEPLSNSFNGAEFFEAIKARKAPVKSVLLDQSVVAGLGNIYVCEALFRSQIDPRRKAATLSLDEVQRLTGQIKDVLREAIKAGGSTLKDFSAADGTLGYFQHSFDVYGREGAPCRACNAPVARIAQSGRSTFFCPACQI